MLPRRRIFQPECYFEGGFQPQSLAPISLRRIILRCVAGTKKRPPRLSCTMKSYNCRSGQFREETPKTGTSHRITPVASSAGLRVAPDPLAQRGMLVPTVNVGPGDTDSLGRQFVVAGVFRRQDRISAREQQAGRDLRLDRQK